MVSGGKLYIGIDDKGKVTGIDNHNKLLEDLPNKFRDILGVYAEVNLHTENQKYYLEIIVPRYDVPISVRQILCPNRKYVTGIKRSGIK